MYTGFTYSITVTMSQTFDLTQEPFAMLTLFKDQEPIKVHLIKRKEKQSFIDLQKKAENNELAPDYDMVEIIKPYVDEADRQRFEKHVGDLTLYQMQRLSEVFFEMNGMNMVEAIAKAKDQK